MDLPRCERPLTAGFPCGQPADYEVLLGPHPYTSEHVCADHLSAALATLTDDRYEPGRPFLITPLAPRLAIAA